MEIKSKKQVIYGIILPDISRRLVGNDELIKDSQTYEVSRRFSLNYIYSNMRELWANRNES